MRYPWSAPGVAERRASREAGFGRVGMWWIGRNEVVWVFLLRRGFVGCLRVRRENFGKEIGGFNW